MTGPIDRDRRPREQGQIRNPPCGHSGCWRVVGERFGAVNRWFRQVFPRFQAARVTMIINVETEIERCTRAPRRAAFTLVEIMIVVAVIGLLAAIAIPNFVRARNVSQGVRVANDLRIFGDGFAVYSFEKGTYPPDSHEVLPSVPDIEQYVDAARFTAPTVIGGRYNWEGPDSYPYAGVSVSGSSLSVAELRRVDQVVDDGDLDTGNYRRPSNGRFTYIIEE